MAVSTAFTAAAAVASLTEELLFRGVVQTTVRRSAGRVGLLAASALYAATYLGLAPAALVMAMALAGLIFSYAVARSGSLTGSVLGHALFVLGAGGPWTILLGRHHPLWIQGTGVTVALGVALALMTVVLLRAGRRQSRP